MASSRGGAGAPRPHAPIRPITRILLRLTLAGAVILAGLMTVAFIDANWRFSHLEAAAPARIFSSHHGIDPRAVLRALFAHVRRGEVVQGGSTIAQQLAKNLYPNAGDRTLWRKVWETLAALSLEALRSKSAILERYLSQIYL